VAGGAGPSGQSAAGQLGHDAPWDVVLAACIRRSLAAERRAEVWVRGSLADRWSVPTDSMGRRDTGTEMSDEAAEEMRLPGQEEVVGYARLAFAYADEAIALISNDQLLAVPKVDPDGDTKLDNVLIYLEHLSRHLGMIESIRALQKPVSPSKS